MAIAFLIYLTLGPYTPHLHDVGCASCRSFTVPMGRHLLRVTTPKPGVSRSNMTGRPNQFGRCTTTPIPLSLSLRQSYTDGMEGVLSNFGYCFEFTQKLHALTVYDVMTKRTVWEVSKHFSFTVEVHITCMESRTGRQGSKAMVVCCPGGKSTECFCVKMCK